MSAGNPFPEQESSTASPTTSPIEGNLLRIFTRNLRKANREIRVLS